MHIDISLVSYEKKHVLRNLLEIYLHDMSEFDNDEPGLVLNESGLYGYRYLDYYWVEDGRYPYIVKVDGRIAGFSLIRTVESNALIYQVAEFFILKKYRKLGIGKALILQIFSEYKGNWIISTSIKNTAAQHFWREIVKNSSKGKYKEYLMEDKKRIEWSFGIVH